MALRPKQIDFSYAATCLEIFMWDNGYEFSDGDAFRDDRATFPYSHKRSCHKFRLARDYNISKDGVMLETSDELLPIGEYWESLDPRSRWGGRFGDSGHFSFKHEGVK